MDQRLAIQTLLEQARAETEAFLAEIPDEAPFGVLAQELGGQLAGIAHFEETWLVREAGGQPPLTTEHRDVHEALERARTAQGATTVVPAAARAYALDVRERALTVLEGSDLGSGAPLVRKGFVFGLVLQHERERQEAMLERIQAYGMKALSPRVEPAAELAPGGRDELEVPGGSFLLGAVEEPWAYDGELVPHEVELSPFLIDRVPVSNAAFAAFVDDRGYEREELWSPEGWDWRTGNGAEAPLYWSGSDGAWERIRFGNHEPVPAEEPVQHVSVHEAEAFARWAGKRLPTEAEWERAAGWSERAGKSRFPWGRESMGYEANLDRRRLSPAPVGSYPGGESAAGCLQMAGDVWEWTSSVFDPYPGFVAFPDTGLSEAFFGEGHRVLRGGSWATDQLVARTTFRRFAAPSARRPFAGFRCARDA